MRLTIVGCSGSLPGPSSAASCYLIEVEGFRVLVDLGNGALGPLQRYAQLDTIDAVLISHEHADHCLDLCGYYVYRRLLPSGPLPPIPVYGPPGIAARMVAAYQNTTEQDMGERFDFGEWVEGEHRLGPLVVTVARVAHPVPTYGMRIEHGGRVLAYSADTGPCAALDRLASRADVFLCEAAFHVGRDSEPDLHMTGRDAADCAHRAQVGQLVLTHLPPWNDPSRTLREAAEAYPGPTLLAHPGLVLEIS